MDDSLCFLTPALLCTMTPCHRGKMTLADDVNLEEFVVAKEPTTQRILFFIKTATFSIVWPNGHSSSGWSKWCWYQGPVWLTLWLLHGCMKFVLRSSQLQSSAGLKAICTEAGMLALRERRMKVTQAVPQKLKKPQKPLIFCSCATWKASPQLNDTSRDALDAAFVQADMRKAKEKALYKKKGSYPEGMYL